MFRPYNIASPLFRNRYSGLYSLNGSNVLRPNSVSNLVMWHDASIGGITAVQDAFVTQLEFWTNNNCAAVTGAGTQANPYLVTADATNSTHRIYRGSAGIVSTAAPVVVEAKLRKISGNIDVMRVTGGAGEIAYIDLVAGTTTLGTLTSLGGGWYQFRHIYMTVAASIQISLSTGGFDGALYNMSVGVADVVVNQTLCNALADQTGAVHLTQTAQTSQPALLGNNGLPSRHNGFLCPYIKYDPAATNNKWLYGAAAARTVTNRFHNGTGCTYFLALIPQSNVAVTRVILSTSSSSATATGMMWFISTIDGVSVTVGNSSGTFVVNRTTAAVTVLQPQIYCYHMSTSHGSSLWRAAAGSGAAGVELLAPAALVGAPAVADSTEVFRWNRAATIRNLDAYYMGDALYSRILTATERTSQFKYWAKRLGITL